MSKCYTLKKDIVIKAGTVFSPAPSLTRRAPGHIDYVFGLTDNTTGTVCYDLGDDEGMDDGLDKWFEEREG